MKKNLFIIFFVVQVIFIQAQSSTHTGNIIVNTQAEVNALASTLANIGTIDGDLTIGDIFSNSQRNITDLAPLSSITHVTGNLTIDRNGQLTNLNALNNLQSIGGSFLIYDNVKLTTLGNFSNLQSIGGSFRVNRSDQLTTLGDFSNLQSIGGLFEIFSNDSLITPGNFSVLQSIGGDFFVTRNDRLPTISNFPVLQTIGGVFFVNHNTQLTTLRDFSNLQSVGGDFSVENNAKLATLDNFPALQSIEGFFRVIDNAKLTTLGNFPALQSIGEYFLINVNSELTTLGYFSALQTIGEYFTVLSNDELTTLGNFSSLQSIGGIFDVTGNDQLITLGGFSNLTSIGIGEALVPSKDQTTDNVSIVVEENPKLILCSWIEKFIPTGENAVTGSIYINNNATGCETTEEIGLPVLFVNNRIFAHKDSTSTSFNVYANVKWKLVTSNDATWITSLSSDSTTHSSRITGENEATITLIHTRAPDETSRSTTLILTAIDENGNELTNPKTMIINFAQLSTIYNGSITLSSQEEVNEFTSNTTVIDGNLTIGYTDYFTDNSRSNITDLTPLSNITDITGNLNIQQNGQLVNLNALDSLQFIEGDFEVDTNDKLTTLGDFSALDSIGEYFGVFGNAKLTTLGDFSALQSIGRSFNVSNNVKLTTLRGFSALQSIRGGFGVGGNPNLSTLGDFSALDSIGGSFGVEDNDQLTTLGDFLDLQSIGGYFWVNDNDQLTTLGDFPTLTSIGIVNNVVIPSLGIDESIDSVSIVVKDNINLVLCSWLEKFIPTGENAVTGGIYINNNATGCDDRNTFQNIITSLSTHTKDSLFKFYPNPSEGLLILQVNPTHIPSQLLIYNLVGNPMADYEITTMKKVIDVSDFSPGIYLMILQIDHIRQIIVKRLLKE